MPTLMRTHLLGLIRHSAPLFSSLLGDPLLLCKRSLSGVSSLLSELLHKHKEARKRSSRVPWPVCERLIVSLLATGLSQGLASRLLDCTDSFRRKFRVERFVDLVRLSSRFSATGVVRRELAFANCLPGSTGSGREFSQLEFTVFTRKLGFLPGKEILEERDIGTVTALRDLGQRRVCVPYSASSCRDPPRNLPTTRRLPAKAIALVANPRAGTSVSVRRVANMVMGLATVSCIVDGFGNDGSKLDSIIISWELRTHNGIKNVVGDGWWMTDLGRLTTWTTRVGWHTGIRCLGKLSGSSQSSGQWFYLVERSFPSLRDWPLLFASTLRRHRTQQSQHRRRNKQGNPMSPSGSSQDCQCFSS